MHENILQNTNNFFNNLVCININIFREIFYVQVNNKLNMTSDI
jgi:hypothetical protein